MGKRLATFLFSLLLMFNGSAVAQEPAVGVERPYALTEERESCSNYAPEKRPFFGDTHIHTTLSFDANAQDTRNTPREAYGFARGNRMGIQPYNESGEPQRFIQLERPLDFVALSDHSELLGEVRVCSDPNQPNYSSLVCIAHRNSRSLSMLLFAARGLQLKSRWGMCGDDGQDCRDIATDVWREVRDAAEEAYDRSSACEFTSFIGYEWTAGVGQGENLHRNVVFRNEKVPDYAPSWIDTPSAYHLWERLENECIEGGSGCDVLTIPHNSNISGGWMFGTAKIESAIQPLGFRDVIVDPKGYRLGSLNEVLFPGTSTQSGGAPRYFTARERPETWGAPRGDIIAKPFAGFWRGRDCRRIVPAGRAGGPWLPGQCWGRAPVAKSSATIPITAKGSLGSLSRRVCPWLRSLPRMRARCRAIRRCIGRPGASVLRAKPCVSYARFPMGRMGMSPGSFAGAFPKSGLRLSS